MSLVVCTSEVGRRLALITNATDHHAIIGTAQNPPLLPKCKRFHIAPAFSTLLMRFGSTSSGMFDLI
jgi:hypothetical protein